VKCRVLILRRAQKELKQLAAPEYERVRDAIYGLVDDPRPAIPANSRHVLDFVCESAIIGSFTTSIPGDGRS
jgi:mRNA-degrading endonuclease RelE of RelBE toxin-antitoxin system